MVTLLYSGGKQNALSAMVSWLHTGTPALATSDWLTRAASTETRVQAVISVLGYVSTSDGDIANTISLLFNSFIFHSLLIWRCYEKLLYNAIFECASWRIYLILFQDRMLPTPIYINCIGNIQQVSCLLKFSGLILILILEGKASPSLAQWRPWV